MESEPASSLRYSELRLAACPESWTMGRAWAYKMMDVACGFMRDTGRAERLVDRAAGLCEQAQRWAAMVSCPYALGCVYDRMDDTAKAVKNYRESLVLSRRFGLKKDELDNLALLGDVLARRENYREALQYWTEWWTERTAVGDTNHRNEIGNIGLAYLCLGEYERAKPFFRLAVREARKRNEVSYEADQAELLGMAYRERAQMDSARLWLEHSLRLYRQCRNVGMMADVKVELGKYWQQRCDYARATQHLQRGRALAGAAGNQGVLAMIVAQEARMEEQTRDYQAALVAARKALPMVKAMGDAKVWAQLLGGVGTALVQTGAHQAADDTLRLAVRLLRAAGDSALVAGTLATLGANYGLQGRRDSQLQALNEALAALRNTDARNEMLAMCLASLAEWHLADGRSSDGAQRQAARVRSEALGTEALGIFQDLGNVPGMEATARVLAEAEAGLHQAALARASPTLRTAM